MQQEKGQKVPVERKQQRRWEKIWDEIIEEAGNASERSDWVKRYKTLRKMSLRDEKRTARAKILCRGVQEGARCHIGS